MSGCDEIGHRYKLGLLDGVAVYGCTGDCGDIIPLKDYAKADIIKYITEHLYNEKARASSAPTWVYPQNTRR
jgi:hypothetical protein